MKKYLGLGLVLAGGFSANALQFTDTDLFSTPLQPMGALLVYGVPITGTFNIAGGDGGAGDISGYNPTTQTILSATAGFTFIDYNGTANTVSIQLDTEDLVSNGSINMVMTSFNGSVVGNAYVTLNSTGIIDYKVELVGSPLQLPVFLLAAGLEAQAGDRVIVSVPDTGTTLSLLGFGILVGAVVGRRLLVSKQS